MIRLLLLTLLPLTLIGCNDDWAGTVIRYPTVYYVGDSLCTPNTHFLTAQQRVGVRSDCLWGQTMTNAGDLPAPPQADLVFLALGSNDAVLHLDPVQYGQQLATKLSRTSARVYCVLPMVSPNLPADAFRKQMLKKCTHTLDPVNFGVDIMDGDMQHWGEADHANFVNGLISVLTVEGFIETPPEEIPAE